MSKLLELKKELRQIADPKRAEISQGFFKTGKGEYGEGDVFLGITVPQSRKIAVKFKNLAFSEILELLKSKIHEERLIALLILVDNFDARDERASHNARASRDKQEKIYDFYLKNIKYINNWDLVDLSADKIVGGYLFSLGSVHSLNDSSEPGGDTQTARKRVSRHTVGSSSDLGSKETVKSSFREELHPILILTKLANSKNIWERRIAMVATYYFIKNGKFDATLKIAEILLSDNHDLIHKAVGWMLREVGKKDLKTELKFLNKHYRQMPRTALRYSIEKFPEKLRQSYLNSRVNP